MWRLKERKSRPAGRRPPSSGFRDEIAPSILHRPISALLQVTYAWVMTFGLMGLFRRLLTSANDTIRYISDSSYWLYLAHVPLIIGAQMMVRDWPIPATAKFTLVCGGVTAFLLITYQTLVRYMWLGRFLNGPRKRPEKVQPVSRTTVSYEHSQM
jgi:peptidoglycan/LPS O-acetylase OafA/YrhL